MQNVVFQTAGVALDNGLADVLGYRQQEQLAGNFDISGCQETDELPIVLQLPEGALCLDGAIHPEQPAFFRGDPAEGGSPIFGKFPADCQFLPSFQAPGLAACRSVRAVAAIFHAVFRSITSDNGSEFSSLPQVLPNTPIYYAHPYSSYERGLNEKQNSLIRRFFPKGCSLDGVSPDAVQRVQDWINRFPRKSFSHASAAELFQTALFDIAI